MPYFQPVDQNPNFSTLEKNLLQFWVDHDIIDQYLHQYDDASKTFSFIDGPITANNPMGVHHARGRALKDTFQRYHHACGHAQRFQNGFDCQGLWVEVEVEKDAGYNCKKDIIDAGLDKFTTACVNRVKKFSEIQTEQSKRLGMFMDWPNSYYTMSETNNLAIWAFLKKVESNGWLTKRKSAATWCPRCETGLSQHEQADGYKDITDVSVYLKFKLKNKSNEYILAWTTTPWTLSANVLLAINTNFEYVKAKSGNDLLYLAKTSADRLGLTDYQTIDPKTLLDLEYESLYDIPVQKNVKHYICQWDLVDPVEGTGVVHVAPGCGQEDFDLGVKLKSDFLAPLDETGHFIAGYGDLTGHYAHNVAPAVFEYLKSVNALFKTENVTHRYPHCWRCGTKCLFRLEDSWYIKSDEIRPQLKKAAATVNWHPKYVGRRMQNWLDTMEDWMISRKRFYGLALPFFPCSCGKLTVVGSKEELKSLAVNPKLVDELKSLHRPYIDEIEIKCPQCSQPVHRIPDVGDCWLDAGVVPFSTLKYFEDKNYWKKWFPADLVLEMIEQVRLWFYSMLFFSVTFEDVAPYKDVVCHAMVLDQNGERISKSKRNGIPYDEAVEKMSADAMRWVYYQQTSYTNVNFGYSITDQVKRDFLLILWNSYRFFTEHANLANWQPSETTPAPSNVLDRWIISRLHSTIKKVSHSLDKFSTAPATKVLEKFVSDFSTWYIRRSRDRADNFQVVYQVLDHLVVVLAPFLPFMSELIYQNLHQNQGSVHLQKWPTANDDLIDPKLETDMAAVRDLCQQIHSLRQQAGLKVRQPLSQATITTKIDDDLIAIIQDETNVKKVIFGDQITLDTNLTPALKAEGEYRDLVRNIQVMRKDQKLSLTDKIRLYAPTWPREFESEILAKTLAVSIEEGAALSLQKV